MKSSIFLLFFFFLIFPSACQQNVSPTPVPVVELSAYSGSLLALLPEETTSYLHIQLDQIREDGRFISLIERIETDEENAFFHQIAANADEILLAWDDPLFTERINFMRAEFDRQTLFSEFRSENNFAGGAFAYKPVGPHKIWFRPEGGWAITVPASNLVITGTLEKVESFIPNIALDQTINDSNPTISGHAIITNIHHRLLQASLGNQNLVRRLSVIENVHLTATLGIGADLTIRLGLAENTDPTELLTLFAALYMHFDNDSLPPIPRLFMEQARLDVDIETGDVLIFMEFSHENLATLVIYLENVSSETSNREPQNEAENSCQLPK